jgi:maltose alpha-D-glucosyltransferase/alpha-amylase
MKLPGLERKMPTLEEDPLWYKDAVIYELPVKAFCDSNGDGIGDFQGLLERLDYLEDLGITAIWLLPFYPSPLKDDGYDISDYFNVHPDYGTLKDFREFLREAHGRGIRVISELVLNHTSDQHAWFQKSRRAAPGSAWRDFYVWSNTPMKYKDARIIFNDFETSNWAWDPVSKDYYWHRFYSHQPDLNYDSPRVRRMVLRAIDYWLEMGVNGLRLDAVPYLFEREGTQCENLPETYAFLKELRAHIDKRFPNRMLLAEANQWPEDAAAYFGQGDICHMAFHFPLMPRIYIGLQMEDRFPIIDILEQTPKIPELCQWALFLRNHDELTLEMVTDEERDYMYRVYAGDPQARINLGIRRRLAPLLNNNRRRMELMHILLFALPGTPVLYYGDEIGMGDNYYLGDRNGVRTPMQWRPDRNAGFSRANPQRLYLPVIIDPEYHYEAVNVENSQRNPSSLLWWMKRVIALRKKFKAFGRGDLDFLRPENPKILAFLRTYGEEIILVVVNLSRYYQVVELDLTRYAGYFPEEIFSQNRFPLIRESPYVLTLGPHGYLLSLLKKVTEGPPIQETGIPELPAISRWQEVFDGEARDRLENEILPEYLKHCRWFGGKARAIRAVRIMERIPVENDSEVSYLLLFEIQYIEGMPDIYLLPVSFAVTKRLEQPLEEMVIEGLQVRMDYEWLTLKAKMIMEEFPQSVIARLCTTSEEGILYDAAYDDRFREALLNAILRRKRIKGEKGEFLGTPGRMLRRLLGDKALPLNSQVLKAEQSNTSILYEDRLHLKVFRSLTEGVNPDSEVVRFLTEKTAFPHIPPFAGSVEYRQPGSEPITLALLQGFVPSQSDGWTYTLGAVGRYFEQVLSRGREIHEIPQVPASLLDIDFPSIPPRLRDLMEGHFLEMAVLLGKRTGEMHLALSSVPTEKDFAPEPFSLLYQRSLYQSLRTLLRRVSQVLRSHLKELSEPLKEDAVFVLESEPKILESFQKFLRRKFSAMRIRIHGDYHLGQVLYTGKDFVIFDFEGEPARALGERRLKRSPLTDVAGMIRSFHYAGSFALHNEASIRKEDAPVVEPWVELWCRYVSGIFLRSYLDSVGGSPFIPKDREELEIMVKAFLLEKAVYELGYDLNNRPGWIMTPLRGIRALIREG